MLKEYILEMYNFNCWGRDRMLSTAESLSLGQLDQETRFPNHAVKETLIHALSAEHSYRTRCQQQPKVWLDESQFPDLKSIRDYWAEEEQKMRSYLNQITDADLGQVVRYKTSSGDEFARTRLVILTQLFFHGMQHRSEIAEMLTEFGHSPGDIDYTVYRDSIAPAKI